jgi:hypothetical protein
LTIVQIGGVSVPLEKAQRWVREYTSEANTSASHPYAYPAYDQYESGRNNPFALTDADLLAPGLLNVPVKIRSYYGLQRIRPALEAALSNEDLGLALGEIEDPARISAMVGPLYAVLDDRETKPWHVNGTTLSKILHRKRPESLVLHDKWVRRCYLGPRGPVPQRKGRTWADYMAAISVAIGRDIRTQRSSFVALDDASTCPGELSYVRLLDILAWKSKGEVTG